MQATGPSSACRGRRGHTGRKHSTRQRYRRPRLLEKWQSVAEGVRRRVAGSGGARNSASSRPRARAPAGARTHGAEATRPSLLPSSLTGLASSTSGWTSVIRAGSGGRREPHAPAPRLPASGPGRAGGGRGSGRVGGGRDWPGPAEPGGRDRGGSELSDSLFPQPGGPAADEETC